MVAFGGELRGHNLDHVAKCELTRDQCAIRRPAPSRQGRRDMAPLFGHLDRA